MRQHASLSHSRWEYKYHVVLVPKCREKARLGSCGQETCAAKGKLDRERAPDRSSCAYDDLDFVEIRGIAGGGLHQRKERDSHFEVREK